MAGKMSPPTLLVADDSATVRKVFQLAFETEDVEVVTAADGKEALAMARERIPAMVIADTDMPGLDGFDLCLALKRDPKTRSVPVYLLTSALLEYDLARAEKSGADGKLEKPFRSEEMVRKTLKAISGGPSGKPPLEQTGEEDAFEDFGDQVDWLLEEAEKQMMEEEMEKIGPAVKKAMEEMAAGGELAKIVEEAVAKRLASGALEEAVSQGISLAMEKLRPQIMEQVTKTTRQEAIRVAEDLVKKAIAQVKNKSGA